ncbi:MAG: hypothetical protein RL329_508 [Bacteroidota bacterium]|jgi:hypothetical protein
MYMGWGAGIFHTFFPKKIVKDVNDTPEKNNDRA